MTSLSILVIREGISEPAFHEAPLDITIADLVRQAAPDHADVRAFLPDADHPLDGAITVADAGLTAGAEITIARAKTVEVLVRYAGHHKKDEWLRHHRLRKVFRWALKAYDIPAGERPKFELALAGGQVVDLDATLAQYLQRGRDELTLDLRMIVAPQGER